MAKLYNLARVETTTTGSGTMTLGDAVTGCLTFANAGVQDGDVVSYSIIDSNSSEVGRGTYTESGTTLARTTVLASTNSGSVISLSGNAQVAIVMLAQDTLYSDYIRIEDQKAQYTSGGTFTASAWQTRDLNTEVTDTGSHASVSSNQISLSAGTYRCLIVCPCMQVDANQSRLYNISGSSVLILGSNAYSSSTNPFALSISIIKGRFTITATKTIEVQHYCGTTRASYGFGTELNIGTEVYTIAEFWKEAR